MFTFPYVNSPQLFPKEGFYIAAGSGKVFHPAINLRRFYLSLEKKKTTLKTAVVSI